MSVIFDDEKPEAYHWRMATEKRIDKLETDDESHKAALDYLKANSATKDDIREVKVMIAESESRMMTRLAESETMMMGKLAESEIRFADLKGEVKAQIAEAKTSIIQWVVTAVFIAQLLPALLKLLIPG